MIRYTIKRLLLLIPIIIGAAFIVSLIMEMTPGDPITLMLGDLATEQRVAELTAKFGLDKPFLLRFLNFIIGLFTRFDFGTSWRTSRPVLETLLTRAPATLTVAFMSIGFATIVGVSIGVLSAVKQYSPLDNYARVTAMMLGAVPTFWLGMMLIVLFSLKLGWLPTSGVGDIKHFILPMLMLGLPYGARQLRGSRTHMLEAIRKDHVRTARAKGAPERRVIWIHALGNALLPIINSTAAYISGLLGGAVVCETLFGLNGIGSYIVNAVKQKDIPCVVGGVVFLAIMVAILMLIVDLLHAYVDPRVKARYARR